MANSSASKSKVIADSERIIARMIAVMMRRRMIQAGVDTGGAEPWSYLIVGGVQLATHSWMSNPRMTRDELIDYLTMLSWNALCGIVEVGGVHAHASAYSAGFAEGHANGYADVGEGAVVIVVVKLVGLGVVGDEEIDPAVVVEVEERDAQRFTGGIGETRFFGDVLKNSVALVVVEAGALAFIGLRRAIGFVFVVERTVLIFLDGPFDVVGDEQVELAVVVVVEPHGAGGKAGAGDAGFRGDIGEFSVT